MIRSTLGPNTEPGSFGSQSAAEKMPWATGAESRYGRVQSLESATAENRPDKLEMGTDAPKAGTGPGSAAAFSDGGGGGGGGWGGPQVGHRPNLGDEYQQNALRGHALGPPPDTSGRGGGRGIRPPLGGRKGKKDDKQKDDKGKGSTDPITSKVNASSMSDAAKSSAIPAASTMLSLGAGLLGGLAGSLGEGATGVLGAGFDAVKDFGGDIAGGAAKAGRGLAGGIADIPDYVTDVTAAAQHGIAQPFSEQGFIGSHTSWDTLKKRTIGDDGGKSLTKATEKGLWNTVRQLPTAALGGAGAGAPSGIPTP